MFIKKGLHSFFPSKMEKNPYFNAANYLGSEQRISRKKDVLCFLMVSWSLCAIVVSNAYTGKIISNLLEPRPFLVVNSLEELTTSSLGWIVRHGTSLESNFLVQNWSILLCTSLIDRNISLIFQMANRTNITDWKIGNGLRKHPEWILEKGPDRDKKIRNYVSSGRYAYIGVGFSIYNISHSNFEFRICYCWSFQTSTSIERVMVEDYFQTKQCNMKMMNRIISSTNNGFVLQKGSPLTSIFSRKYAFNLLYSQYRDCLMTAFIRLYSFQNATYFGRWIERLLV